DGTTPDNIAYGWDSTANGGLGAYATVAGLKSVGLARDAAIGANLIRLPAVRGHYRDDTQSCYACHGSSYGGSSSNNVHNPSGGVSSGGTPCYDCHVDYQSPMEDGLGAKTGSNRGLPYHHVLGGTVSATYTEGDTAPNTGTYPNLTNASRTDVFCVSCHTDHNYFNANKGANLRTSVTAAGSSVSASDYDSTADVGVCTSCHDQSLAKQAPGTDQKSDGSTVTPKVLPGATAGQFGASAHDYYASSSYGVSAFSANCSKCHNDEQTKEWQTSTSKFGTHWSATRRLVSALGGTAADPLQESHCYRCHSRTTDAIGGTVKTASGRDYYDAAAMTTAAERVFAQFQLASKHPVIATGLEPNINSVECESCHNAHVVNSTSDATRSRVTNPDDGYSIALYNDDASQAAFCLKCHDGTPPAYDATMATYVPYT
ncbi:photosynthetic reaction center cytochrome c subunit, partial [bacterium]|nr:photosynthetic reaction center cytochrome c subunit [bacterium]